MRTVPKKGKARRKPVLYSLESISSEGMEGTETGLLRAEGPYVVAGELLGSILVSVPETMSQATALDLDKQLANHFGKPVCVVTHNISFLRMRRVTQKEAVKVAERIPSKKDSETKKELVKRLSDKDRYEVCRTEDGDVEGHTVEVGTGESVVLDKMFGPSIFNELRVTAAITNEAEWLVERGRDDGSWVELGRFPACVEEGGE